MQVTADRDFAAVRNCQMIEIKAGQQLEGDLARYLLTTGAPVSSVDDEAEAALRTAVEARGPGSEDLDAPVSPVEETAEGEAEDVGEVELDIDAKIDDVLAWVGEDPVRARTAWDAEVAKGDKARTTLLGKLEEIAATEDDPDSGADGDGGDGADGSDPDAENQE